MAITKGLFGFDPYEVQQQQTQRLLAPITQASNPYERIGASLGTILGASMFDIKDPRLAKAAKITAITKQVMGEEMNPTDPELPTKLQNLSKVLFDEGEVDAAMFALEQAQKFTPKDKFITGKAGDIIYRQSPTGELTEVASVPDKEVMVKTPADFAAAGRELGFGVRPNIGDYTQAETQAINNLLERRGIRKAEAGVPKSGEVKITDLKGAQDVVNEYTKGPKEKLDTVRQLGISIRQVKGGVGTALPQVSRNLVKLVGDSQIGMAEAKSALGSVGIVGDVISGIEQLFSGVPSAQKIADVEKFVKALEAEHAKSYNLGRKKAEAVLGEARLNPNTVKTLIPPEYKLGGQKPTSNFVEGKIYKDAKGNRARYVNGKWEPVQ